MLHRRSQKRGRLYLEIQKLINMMRVNEMQVRLSELGLPETTAEKAGAVIDSLLGLENRSDEQNEALAAAAATLLCWVAAAADCSGYPVSEMVEDVLCGRL